MTVNSYCKKKLALQFARLLNSLLFPALEATLQMMHKKKWMCRHVTVYVDMNANSDNTKSESHANPNIWG